MRCIMNVRSRIQSCLVLLVVPAFCFRATQGSLAGTEKMTKVCGTVSMMSDVPERIKAAKLKFNGSDGAVVEVTANEMGEYQVLLKPETEYRVTMVAGRLCQLHRPGFRAESGATLKFDFVTPS